MMAHQQWINQISEGHIVIDSVRYNSRKKIKIISNNNRTDLTLAYANIEKFKKDKEISIIGAYVIDNYMKWSNNHYYSDLLISEHEEKTQKYFFEKVVEIQNAMKEEGENLIFCIFDENKKITYFSKKLPV